MKIEHTAFQVTDPVALAAWYVSHLGLTVKRAQSAPPFGHFLADDGDAVMLEFYNNPRLPVPDYRDMDPLLLHIALRADDVAGTRARLMAAGATPVGDVQDTDAGHRAMLAIRNGRQLVHRRDAMIG